MVSAIVLGQGLFLGAFALFLLKNEIGIYAHELTERHPLDCRGLQNRVLHFREIALRNLELVSDLLLGQARFLSEGIEDSRYVVYRHLDSLRLTQRHHFPSLIRSKSIDNNGRSQSKEARHGVTFLA